MAVGLSWLAGGDVIIDAKAEALAGHCEHAGAGGCQIFGTGARGDVVEDFDGEVVCRQRLWYRLIHMLCERRVGLVKFARAAAFRS